jgi:hypothetical protein
VKKQSSLYIPPTTPYGEMCRFIARSADEERIVVIDYDQVSTAVQQSTLSLFSAVCIYTKDDTLIREKGSWLPLIEALKLITPSKEKITPLFLSKKLYGEERGEPRCHLLTLCADHKKSVETFGSFEGFSTFSQRRHRVSKIESIAFYTAEGRLLGCSLLEKHIDILHQLFT